MIIAVPYADGAVSDHFGRTECFKLYETEGSNIVSEKDVKTEGRGHYYMVQFLIGYNTSTVICRGMGEPSRKALEIAGIRVALTELVSADEAVKAFLEK